MQPLRFLLTTLGLCVFVVLLHRPTPTVDIFAAIPRGTAIPFTPMTEAELLQAKLVHSRLNPKYEVGLFGNSRSVMIAASDVGLNDRKFFNFSVPGASIRSSIYMIEELRRAGKVPKLVIVSFDHMELEFYGNPAVRGLLSRFRLAAADLRLGMSDPSISPRAMGRMIWRHVNAGVASALRYFNYGQVAIGLDWWLSPAGPDPWLSPNRTGKVRGYRRDGSRDSLQDRGALKVRRRSPSIIAGYLKHDLQRLARAAGNARVVIYESPVHPSNGGRFREKPAENARRIRRLLVAQCRKLGFYCRTFPATLPGDDGSTWRDGTHAPASLLGGYIKVLIAAAARPTDGRPTR